MLHFQDYVVAKYCFDMHRNNVDLKKRKEAAVAS